MELFASDKQHVLDLYCSKGKNCSYKFYWPSFGMAYGNPRFSELGKVLTKVALERSRMVLCSPDWGAHGGNEYWRTLLDKLTISSVRLPDEAIYVPLGRKTPIGKPGCTYDFSSCFFPKFKKSAKRGFSREMTYFFGFYGPKIRGGAAPTRVLSKNFKNFEIWLILGYFCLLWACPAEQCCTPMYLPIEDFRQKFQFSLHSLAPK